MPDNFIPSAADYIRFLPEIILTIVGTLIMVLQPILGLTASSLLFGGVHVGGRRFIGYGAWAACIGACMGWLTMSTGGLMAPYGSRALSPLLRKNQ